MLIFLDLETTGLEEGDRICSIGLIGIDGEDRVVKYDLVNEGKKISSKASSINHITNEMLRGKPKLQESAAYKFLQEHNCENTTIVAHNIQFDLKMLLACGFNFEGKVIDTLRVTKHLIPECDFFSLQFLRYELKLYRDEPKEILACGITNELKAHSALSDAIVVQILYCYLLEMVSHEEMHALSAKKVLMQKLSFGKYSGRYIEDIGISDRKYLEWMVSNILDLDEDLRYSIDYYLQGRV